MEKIILEKVKSTEKAVRMLEQENILCFIVDRKIKKEKIKIEVENLFKVKVYSVRTLTRNNKKIAYVKLNPEFVATDVATKIGVI